MKPTPTPTLETIAAKVGASVSTVSRALANDRRISATTAKRIKAEAEKQGYRPNPLISTLMSHLRACKPVEYQSTIAYLDVSTNPAETDRWGSTRQYYEAVRRHAFQLGYSVDRFWFRDPEISPRQLVKILHSRGIHGLLIHYLPTPENEIHELDMDLSHFAVASLGSKIDSPTIHYSCADHFAVVQLALTQLQALGYRRIGFAMDAYTENIVEGRFLGSYLRWAATAPAADVVPHFVPNVFSEASFATWFRSVKPEAILCIDSNVLNWLRRMGVSVPKDVGVVHLDQYDEEAPGLSGVKQRHDAIAASAVDLIIGQLHRNERGVPETPKAVLVGGEWVGGATVRSLAGKATVRGKQRRRA